MVALLSLILCFLWKEDYPCNLLPRDSVSVFLVLISFPIRGTALSVLNKSIKIIFSKQCKNIFYILQREYKGIKFFFSVLLSFKCSEQLCTVISIWWSLIFHRLNFSIILKHHPLFYHCLNYIFVNIFLLQHYMKQFEMHFFSRIISLNFQ